MNKFVELFDLGNVWGKATIKLVDGNSTVVLIKRIDDMLAESKEMFEDHKAIIPAGSQNSFIIRYRRLKTEAVKLKQQLRAGEKPGSSARSNDTKDLNQKAEMLYDSVETYHEDMLATSQRAQQKEHDDLFADLDYDQPAPSTPMQEDRASVTLQGTQSSILESDTSPLASSHIRTLANLGLDAPSLPVEESEKTYRLALYLETGDDQVLLMDSEPMNLAQNESEAAEARVRLLTMMSKGLHVLRTRSLQSIDGKSNCTEDDKQWVDSVARKMSMMGLGMGVISSVPAPATAQTSHT